MYPAAGIEYAPFVNFKDLLAQSNRKSGKHPIDLPPPRQVKWNLKYRSAKAAAEEPPCWPL
jgi:hypothetical protein